ncbi:TIGR02996 domain-containing protein [Gemmata sp.]|uniref:TIGR02996 domain-containing protein n=1 Tax=Gemmata sp. TaxID=1914242 RepID=UPI003F6E7CA6
MSTPDQLHQAIADQPEEDTPRLALADWLDEHGGGAGAARAEFIRLQITLAGEPAETDEAATARRAAELLERHRGEWGFPAGPLRTAYEVRRGFVDELIVRAGRAADTLALLPRHPVTRLRLDGFDAAAFEAFVILGGLETRAFRKVRHLEVRNEDWTDELVDRLLGLGHFPYLESLALEATAITPVSVRAVAACPRLSDLRALAINYPEGYWLNPQQHALRGVKDSGVAALVASPHLGRLRGLSLRHAGIGPSGAHALAESETLAHLDRLVLTDNPDIDKPARHALAQRFGDRVVL